MTETKTIRLGAEYDHSLRAATAAILRRWDAKQIDNKWGVGGSQELSEETFLVRGHEVTFEGETFIGFSVTGPAEIVEELAAAIGAELDELRQKE